MQDLPPEIIADILLRLPVKPLLRSRCVSKPWCALIDSPNFINMHLNRSIQTRTNLSVVGRTNRRLCSIDLDSLDRAVELDPPLKPGKHNYDFIRVWGSCNGLLCLGNAEEDVVLWNPSTKKHLKLPVWPIENPPPSCDFEIVVLGFGFDSTSDDYKVVRMVQYRDDAEIIDTEVRVYSLKSDSWRVKDFPRHLSLLVLDIPGSHGKLAGGALHWTVSVNPGGNDQPRHIIAFDLRAEGFQIVPQPDHKDTRLWDLGVLDGRLCVTFNYGLEVEGFDIWVMEKYEVNEYWMKLISVKPSDLIRSLRYLNPVACAKNRRKVLCQHHVHGLIWYDLESKVIERVELHDMASLVQPHICLGSLVPLVRGGVEVTGRSKQHKTKQRNRTIATRGKLAVLGLICK